MSDKIKYGETYKSLAENIAPYLGETNRPVYNITNYPPWWETTITLYNRHENPETQLVKWYRTIIHNCYLSNTSIMSVDNNLVVNQNSTLIRIPENQIFLPYENWQQLDNLEKTNYFTLRQGDIIIKGEISDIIDETKRGMYSTDLIERYKVLGICTVIDSVKLNVGTGIGTPHYRVNGD